MNGECSACGGPDGLGLGLCPACGGSAAAGDTLVFVRRPDGRIGRRTTEQRLGELLGGRTDTPDGRQAARGSRALIRAPAAVSERVIASLERRGVPARSVAASRAVLAMPPHFFLLIGAIATVGTMAGVATGSPALALVSPLFASALLLSAHRAMQQPWLRAPARDTLPDVAESALLSAFSQLPAGRPREILADLAGLARPLVTRLRRDGDPGALEQVIGDLIRAACDTALEVDRLEAGAAIVRGAHVRGDPATDSAADRCEEAAHIGTRRLIEAAVTVADAGTRTALLDGSASHRLAGLLRDLREESIRRGEALAEIGRLVPPV